MLDGGHPTGRPEHRRCQAGPAGSLGLGGGPCGTSHLVPRGAQRGLPEGVCGAGEAVGPLHLALLQSGSGKAGQALRQKAMVAPQGWAAGQPSRASVPPAPPAGTFPPPNTTQSRRHSPTSWSPEAEPDREALRQASLREPGPGTVPRRHMLHTPPCPTPPGLAAPLPLPRPRPCSPSPVGPPPPPHPWAGQDTTPSKADPHHSRIWRMRVRCCPPAWLSPIRAE